MEQNILNIIFNKIQQQGYADASLNDAEKVYQQLSQNKLIQDCVSLSIHTVMKEKENNHTTITITNDNNLPISVLMNQFTNCDTTLENEHQIKVSNTDVT